jgi:N-acetylneuraminic acid mutarotase
MGKSRVFGWMVCGVWLVGGFWMSAACDGKQPSSEVVAEMVAESQGGVERTEDVVGDGSEGLVEADASVNLDATPESAAEIVTDGERAEPSPEQMAEVVVEKRPESPPESIAPPQGEWSALADLPIGPLQEIAVVAVGEKIYILGGIDEKKRTTKQVLIYDTRQKTWSNGAELPLPMHHINAAVVNGKIYVVGALLQSFLETDGIYVYDPTKDTWVQEGMMPQGRSRGASSLGVIDGKIYVAGGFRGYKAVADFSVYDPMTKQWKDLPSLPMVRDHAMAGVIDGVLYLAGGRDTQITAHTARFAAFDPRVGVWRDLPDMPTSRGGAAAAVCGGRFYIFGGEGNPNAASQVFDQTEVFDPVAGKWFAVRSMKTPRHGMAAVSVGDQVFVPGGATVLAFGAAATFEVFVCTK